MTPFMATAHLSTPPALDWPLMLDAVLFACLGMRQGAQHPSGWVSPPDASLLPLARVGDPDGLWWYACSQITPVGPEQRDFRNRVPPVAEYARWTTNGSVNVASGPDKRMRVPLYYRPGMTRLTWFGIGDVDEVGSLLRHASGVGRLRSHGWGQIYRWEVTSQAEALDFSSPSIRHVPAREAMPSTNRFITRRRLPLLPPYWSRVDAVECLQEVRC